MEGLDAEYACVVVDRLPANYAECRKLEIMLFLHHARMYPTMTTLSYIVSLRMLIGNLDRDVGGSIVQGFCASEPARRNLASSPK